MNYKHLKRLLDICIVIWVDYLFPIMLITAVAIKIDSSGPMIFKQKRLGLSGKPFTMYKFRSMSVGAELGGVYEKKADPRVTRGRGFIRRTKH